jgi:hypothetical protein
MSKVVEMRECRIWPCTAFGSAAAVGQLRHLAGMSEFLNHGELILLS